MSDLISVGSLVIFIIVTIIYYLIGKNQLTIDDIQTADGEFNSDGLVDFYSSNLPRLAIYFLVVVISQFILNASSGTLSTSNDTYNKIYSLNTKS